MRVSEIGYFLKGSWLGGEDQGPGQFFQPTPRRRPAVSCVMPTRGHLFPARFAVDCFLKQSYPNRELVVVCASAGSEVEQYLAKLRHPQIRFFHALGAATVGEMRNAAIRHARGELICVWDDDDLSHPRRIATQVSGLQTFGGSACLLARQIQWWPARRRLAVSQSRTWENSMLAVRKGLPPYPEVRQGGDTTLVDAIRGSGRIAFIDHPGAYVRTIHGSNIWSEEHFEAVFSRATFEVPPQQYETAIRALAAEVPIGEYAAEFADIAARADTREPLATT